MYITLSYVYITLSYVYNTLSYVYITSSCQIDMMRVFFNNKYIT